ncbi:MAG: hypothetical protein ACXWNF_12805 [Isosphaeraceae bacterium]
MGPMLHRRNNDAAVPGERQEGRLGNRQATNSHRIVNGQPFGIGGKKGNLGTGAMEIEIAPGLSPEEQSITIYHEVIEVASLQAKQPPPTVLDLSEQEIDLLAKMAHEQYGLATVETLNHLLRDLGF